MRGIVVVGTCVLAAACTSGASADALGGFPGPGPSGDDTGWSDGGSNSGSSGPETATSTNGSGDGGDTNGTATSAGTTPGVTTSTPDDTSTAATTSSTTATTSSTTDTTPSTTAGTTSTSSSTTSTTSTSTSSSTSDGCANVDYSDDFESGQGAWTHAPTTGDAADDPWQLGNANKGGVTCHSGASCWATYLTGVYGSCQTAEVVSPIIDLSPCAASGLTVQLSFWHWFEYEVEDVPTRWWDGAMVQISADGGSSWSDVTPTPGYQGTINGGSGCSPTGSGEIQGHQGWSGLTYGNFWHQVTVNVAPAFRTSNFRARFVHGSDALYEEYGWLIDDFAVTTF